MNKTPFSDGTVLLNVGMSLHIPYSFTSEDSFRLRGRGQFGSTLESEPVVELTLEYSLGLGGRWVHSTKTYGLGGFDTLLFTNTSLNNVSLFINVSLTT